MSKATTFVLYALLGLAEQTRGTPKSGGSQKRFFEISKPNLLNVLGMKRLGSSQREDLQIACDRAGIALAELTDRFIFFHPDDLDKASLYKVELKAEVAQLKKWTEHYDKLKRVEADKAWFDEFEG